MITLLLAKVGGEARVLGPGAPLHCRMDRYVGTLFHLLTEAFPGIPEASLAAVRRDLIVVTSAPLEKEASVVGFQPSTLRVAHTDAVSALKATYAVGLNMTIQRSKYELSDLAAPVLTLDETFFAPRSIEGWRKLTLRLARPLHALSEVKSAAKLRTSDLARQQSAIRISYRSGWSARAAARMWNSSSNLRDGSCPSRGAARGCVAAPILPGPAECTA